jgi:multiple sugar transport system permease protein
VLGLWSLGCLGPLYWLALASVERPVDAASGPRYLPFVDFAPSLHGWRLLAETFPDEVIGPYLTTIELSLAVTFITLAIALPAAYALCRWRRALPLSTLFSAVAACAVVALPIIGLGSWWQVLLLVALTAAAGLTLYRRGPVLGPAGVLLGLMIPRIVPPIAIALPLYQLLRGTGMLVSWTGAALADIAVGVPVAVWLLRGYILEVPTELDDAARLDGAGSWRMLRSVVMPIIRPGLCATGLLLFVMCWNEYLFGVYLAAGDAGTLPAYLAGQVAVREQMASAEPQGAFFAALILLSLLPPLVCAVILDRWTGRAARTLVDRQDEDVGTARSG